MGSLSFTSYNFVFIGNENKLEYCHEFLWIISSSPVAFTPGCRRLVVFSSVLLSLFFVLVVILFSLIAGVWFLSHYFLLPPLAYNLAVLYLVLVSGVS